MSEIVVPGVLWILFFLSMFGGVGCMVLRLRAAQYP